MLLYLDDPDRQYAVEVDARQCDRRLPAEDDGREVRVFRYGQEGEEGVRLLREEEAVVEVRTGVRTGSGGTTVLASPSCVVEAFALGDGGAPVRVEPTPLPLREVARDPAAEWVPTPSGPYLQAARTGRPEGTGAWHCMLAASAAGESRSGVMVRLLWAGVLWRGR